MSLSFLLPSPPPFNKDLGAGPRLNTLLAIPGLIAIALSLLRMWKLRLREVEEATSSQSLRKEEPRSLTEVHLVPKYISFCDTGPLPQLGDQKWPLSWFLVLMGSVPQGSAHQWPGLQASPCEEGDRVAYARGCDGAAGWEERQSAWVAMVLPDAH